MDFLKDIYGFFMTRKKFWLLPAFIVLVVVGFLLVIAASSAAGPFIYTLF